MDAEDVRPSVHKVDRLDLAKALSLRLNARSIRLDGKVRLSSLCSMLFTAFWCATTRSFSGLILSPEERAIRTDKCQFADRTCQLCPFSLKLCSLPLCFDGIRGLCVSERQAGRSTIRLLSIATSSSVPLFCAGGKQLMVALYW